jgi:hypothetical protein
MDLGPAALLIYWLMSLDREPQKSSRAPACWGLCTRRRIPVLLMLRARAKPAAPPCLSSSTLVASDAAVLSFGRWLWVVFWPLSGNHSRSFAADPAGNRIAAHR